MNLRAALIETSPTRLSDRCHGSKGKFARRYPETHGIFRGTWLHLVARSLQRSAKLQACPEYLAARRTKNNASDHSRRHVFACSCQARGHQRSCRTAGQRRRRVHFVVVEREVYIRLTSASRPTSLDPAHPSSCLRLVGGILTVVDRRVIS
jgi:hypothetical protein